MAKIKTGLVGALVAGVIVTAVFQERTKAQLRLEIASLDQLSKSAAGGERRDSAAIAAPKQSGTRIKTTGHANTRPNAHGLLASSSTTPSLADW